MKPAVHGTLDLLEREEEPSALDATSGAFTKRGVRSRKPPAQALDREPAEVV
jgi:hypothetical protein